MRLGVGAVTSVRADAAVRHVSIVAGRSYSDAEQKPSVVVTQLPATARHSSRVSGLVSASSSAAVTIPLVYPAAAPFWVRGAASSSITRANVTSDDATAPGLARRAPLLRAA